jgi:UDP-N-acetylglucosamine 4,6-dehydratase
MLDCRLGLDPAGKDPAGSRRGPDMRSTLQGKSVLITGGTGSFGQVCTQVLLDSHEPSRLAILSRDELKQHEMAQRFPDPRMRFFLGDVRDNMRLHRAFDGVDVVIHAAALKQVPAAEYNPIEAIRTNINGAANVIDAALDRGVSRVIALSTDKAANPINLYGATKLAAEKLFVQSNSYAGATGTRFSCVRYGNVVGSRGSVIPLFIQQRSNGKLTITDERMTRFWLTLDKGVRFVIRCIEGMQGGEVFVPKIPSTRIVDLARVIAPGAELENVGIRPGEKLHEVLINDDEARSTLEREDMFVVVPVLPLWQRNVKYEGRPLPDGFRYGSDTNPEWLSLEQIQEIIAPFEAAEGRAALHTAQGG